MVVQLIPLVVGKLNVRGWEGSSGKERLPQPRWPTAGVGLAGRCYRNSPSATCIGEHGSTAALLTVSLTAPSPLPQETLHMNTAGSMEAAERQSEIQVGLAGWLAGVSRRPCQPTAVLSLRCCWPAHTTLLHHHLCSTPLCPSRSVLAMHRACCAA